MLLAAALPGHYDSFAHRFVAGPNGRARDVDSRAVCAVQIETRRLEFAARGTRGRSCECAVRLLTGFEEIDSRAAGRHAARSRTDLRAQRRPHPSWRDVPRSALRVSSVDWLGAVSHADQWIVFVRRGNASRRRRDGRLRTE